MVLIKFTLNEKLVEVEASPNITLLDLLRGKFKITSVKRGCERGECGACTVLINNLPVLSCLVFAPQVDGKRVLTIEGLSKNGKLHPLQEAFIEAGAVQCGYCTPGMILTLKALMDREDEINTEKVKKAIEGNLCRCTGYAKILEAAFQAAKLMGKRIK